MVDNISYVSIKEVADRLLSHPLLQDLTLEAVVRHTVDFIHIFGLPDVYEDKVATLEIESYRAKLPCDLLYIVQVKENTSGYCLRSTTDTFHLAQDWGDTNTYKENTFKVQGTIIYTSFKKGCITVAYKAVKVDEDGFPLIPDDGVFIEALELFIKKKVFTVLFDMQKISPAVLQNTQQEYAWAAKRLGSRYTIPSLSEMESITNVLNQLVMRTNEFRSGFKNLGTKEYWRVHR